MCKAEEFHRPLGTLFLAIITRFMAARVYVK